MTSEERMEALHARMAALREKRERRRTTALGAGSAGLAVCLAALIFGGSHPGGTTGPYSGAMMLFGDAGGYVLAAVLAFMAGVVITVLCIRWNVRGKERPRRCAANEEEKRSQRNGSGQDGEE